LKIYVSSTEYSGTLPTTDTVFDSTFTYGLDNANNLYQYSSSAFTVFKEF